MTPTPDALLGFGRLQITWIYWLLLAMVLLDLFLLGKGLLARKPSGSASVDGPWMKPGPSPRKLRATLALSFALALALGAALLLRAPVAFWIAAAYVVPMLWRFALRFPYARTSPEIGGEIGSLFGGGLQVMVMLAGIASIDPQSDFPLRLTGHLKATIP